MKKQRSKTSRFNASKTFQLEKLEDKALLDASGIFADLADIDASDRETDFIQIANNDIQFVVGEQARNEIVFVDAGVENRDAIIEEIQSRTSVVLNIVSISSDSDGLQQIADYVASHSNIDAVHVLSHGDAGQLQLGNATIESRELALRYTKQLRTLSQSLAEHADILVYGCDLGSSDDGRAFIQMLSELTGADVAASDDLTGHKDLLGDWDLEVKSADAVIETSVFAAAEWSGTLAPGQINGRVFNDANNNGSDDAEGGIAGVTVTAYDAAGSAVASTTSTGIGSYQLAGLGTGVPYRVEFTSLPSGWVSGPSGVDSETAITFANENESGVDFGIRHPVIGPDAGALVNTYQMIHVCGVDDTTDYVMAMTNTPSLAFDTATQAPAEFHHPDWTLERIGNIFFTEFDTDGNVFAPASKFTQTTWNRGIGLSQFGSIGGSDAIYKMDAITGAPTVWATLPQDGNADVNDDSGMGGITYDHATDSMYVVNMFDNRIYRITGAADGTGTVDPVSYLPDPTVLGVSNGFQAVPFGLDIHDGRLYYTVHDYTGNGSLVVRSIALDTSGGMQAATDQLEINQVMPSTFTGFVEGHPVVSDIDFNTSGDMSVGSFTTGPLFGTVANYYENGDASSVYNHGAGVYTFSQTGAVWNQTAVTSVGQENYVTSPNATATGGVAWDLDPANQGGADVLWMSGGDFNGENSNWGIIGYDVSQLDNVFDLEDATNYVQIINVAQAGGPGGNDPKGNGGDVDVFFVEPDSIQIGNYVWLDFDRDGIQDPDETPLEGVTVRLFAADGTTLLATTTTDATGEYYFDSSDGISANTTYVVTFDSSTNATTLPNGHTNADLVETAANTGGGSSVDPDANDSDATSGSVTITTGEHGFNDHTFDAGFRLLDYDLALTKAYTSDTFGNTTDGEIAPGADVTFTIEITNQGEASVSSFQVVDYMPAGFVLNDSNWTAGAGQTATFNYSGPAIASNAGTQIPITLTAVNPLAGNMVNIAEISSDDGTDIDSTTDSNPTNDNQPNAPGDPTDNVIDNTAGDEDDHDIAGVSLYDLALTKVYTADNFDNTTDGIVQPGSDVTFTVEVTNQGSINASTFQVTDHLPLGFTLNDPNWTFNNNATATNGGTATFTYAGAPLAPNAATQIPITLTATAPVNGTNVNWAEISSDDGEDADSTTDTTLGNDNQPVGPGAPTDNVIDNTAGDEDDHDPAGVTVQNYDLALTKVYSSDNFGNTTDGIVEVGSDVTFTISVTNQGSVNVNNFQVTDYLPTGFVLNDPNWTDNGNGTATFTYAGPAVAPNAVVPIAISLTAVSPSAGLNVNWAEISSDDGTDTDSTTDNNQANDNQPNAPGDPTDNVIDNTAGDEDDHDPAAVNVVAYDLAMTKLYTSDSFGNTTDGQIAPGADVTYTINVTNQGTATAASFELIDYLPLGFTLNDPNWTFNNDATATSGGTATFTYAGAPLTPNAVVPITITLNAANPLAGDMVNVAEISNDDGNDSDSTTDSNPANDNQPNAPGDPTDNVIDNAGGDEDDHDIAGVSLYDLALTKVYTSDTFGNATDGFVAPGANVTYTIQVTNQGTIDANTFQVTDHLPLGFTLNDPNWTFNNNATATSGGTATFTYAGAPLTPSNATSINITLTAVNPLAGDMVNWAEISSDDGEDADSTTDTTLGNDNQPAGPGAPTDNVIDNTGGDEDDHDPAGVQVYDLALTKVYTSDNSGNTTDGTVENGSSVTFTIEVTNQGSVPASNFEVRDYIPTGFVLNDANWVNNGNSTATFTYAGPTLAPGSATQIPITLNAVSAGAGDVVNWAEISSDDGPDADSTADTNQANDNQPNSPGDLTDNVIDNTAGDEDDHDPAGVTVQTYDLALTKVYSSDTFGNTTDGIIEVGSDVTFSISVTNQGSENATNFQVTDYLPAGFTLNDANWSDNGNGTATFTYAGPTLATNAVAPITITMTAVSPSAGLNVNWAEISSDDGNDADSTTDTNQANDNQPNAPGDPTDNAVNNAAGDEDDHDPAGVTVVAYDLALTKVNTSDTFGNATDALIAPGADVTYTINITNQGTATVSSFQITDYIPAGFTLNDANWTFNNNATATSGGTATFTYAGAPLAPNAVAPIAITLTAVNPLAGDMVNIAEISSDDGTDIDSTTDTNPANDNQPTGPGDPTDNVIDNTGGDEDDHDIAGVGVYDLALTKVYTSDTYANTTDGIIQPGSDVTFTIEVTNQGSINANAFQVTDHLPLGFTLNDPNWTFNNDATATTGGTATFTYSGAPLAPNDTTQVPITLTAATPQNGANVNWAEISSDDGPDADSTTDTTLGNDNQPAGPGAPTDNVIDNTAGDEDDHDPAGVTVQNYDLALTKVYTSDNFGNTTDGVIEVGSNVTFTINVTNQGSVNVNNFQVTDYLPSGFALNDANWADNGNGTATFTYTGPALASNAVAPITITMTALSPSAGLNVNWAEISSDDGDDTDSTTDTTQANDNQPNAPGDPTDNAINNAAGDEDDHDPAGVTVVAYDLALTKVYTSDTAGNATDGQIAPGADVTYTINITNQGTATVSSFQVTDYMPAGFTLNDPSWADNGNGTATFNYTGAPVAPNAVVPITITLTAVNPMAGNMVNIAEISSDDGTDSDSTADNNPANDNQPNAPGDPTDGVIDNTGGDEDDHDIAGVGVYDLALTKVYTSDTYANTTDGIIQPGSDVTFTIEVTNQGSINAATFEITDHLPLGFTLNDPNWTFNNDATATTGGTATFTYSGAPLAPNAASQVPITLTATAPTNGLNTNWAEISSDDGADADSTTDTTLGNDNQPAGPGAPTDNITDNTAGDEDDHDPAGVTVQNYDLALTKSYSSDNFGNTTDGAIEVGSDVTFAINITNQGSVSVNNFQVTDYLPSGFALNDANWSDNGNGTATFTYAGPAVLPNAVAPITITMTAVSPSAGLNVNWAEISGDDGDDTDSTADANQANDNQPAGPGAPTDNVINNATGDEDDHDPAGVTVVAYDLAMTKAYTSDTFGNATDGQIAPGADVTYTINVINQGTATVSFFELTDYLPAGFTLNDANWTFNNNATATTGGTATFTYTGLPVAPNAVAPVTITLTAVNPSAGNMVNVAEISDDDGTDSDSTTDAIPGNDNPTDDVIDNSNGDEDDHDIAGVDVYDLALTKAYASDSFGNTTDGLLAPGNDVTFSIEVTNQGTVDANTFQVTDHLPLGFVLNDANWTFNNDATATTGGTATRSYTGPALLPGTSVQLPITLTAVSPQDGTSTNWAEISGDDGEDADSTADSLQANDNQPAGPGAPTDGVIDNTGGDEDDHDPAGVLVQNYDLALTKALTSDTFGVPTDGIIEVGSSATFTIEVTNQGTVDASNFQITDYLPNGFVLNDANWVDNGNGTATHTYAGPTLAGGSATQISITMTAVAPSAGLNVNWAEISSDDGDDGDSTADAIQANDNQPTAPGDPTDGVINNAAGDEDDHDLAGLTVVAYDLAMTKTYTSDSFGNATDGQIAPGADVTFTVAVTNQGSGPVTFFELTDYIPAGFTLNDATWTFNNNATATSGGTATFSYAGAPLAPNGVIQVPITLTAVNPTAGNLVNRAEISNDDGTDIDSTSDTNPDNDNQPNAPGDPTDGVIDNTNGDEDDHDLAGVGFYDLALTKLYTSDNFFDPDDGITQQGSNATFTITITNQGTIDANDFEITDYMPTGFTLNDPNWTDNQNGTATFSYAGPTVAPGASVQIPITLAATSPTNVNAVNWAEISADDGDDIDSTTDATQANDNQPAGPGAPTDDTTDNTASDEDDHDPAGVLIASNADMGVSKDGRFTSPTEVVYDFFLEHFGDAQAVNLSLPDNLDAVFGVGNYAVTEPVRVSGASTILPNVNYNGSSDVELLNSTSTMLPGESAHLQIQITILTLADVQNNGLGIFDNEVILTGQSTIGVGFADPSTDGIDPGPGGGGTPTTIALGQAEICGTVYSDSNGSGSFDGNDVGILGVEIILTGTDIFGATVSESTFTDQDGFYGFPDLLPGSYTVTEIQPPQFVDGPDQIGTLGGNTSANDQFGIVIPSGNTTGSKENNFGENGLGAGFISKSLLLSSTPANYWENLGVSGAEALWVPFEALSSGAVQAILIESETIDIELFDESMQKLDSAQPSGDDGTWVVDEGKQYFVRLTGNDTNFNLDLQFGEQVDLPISLVVNDNVVTAVATVGDDDIELVMGTETHLLAMADYLFEFDASVVDTFQIGGSNGHNSIHVTGTRLDDVGNVLDMKATLNSSDYSVSAYGFHDVTFEGLGGYDSTQIFGTTQRDVLSGLPQDSTLTTPDVVMRMQGFERVDSYGRGGDDYAAMYGTQAADRYYTFETFEILSSYNMIQRTTGFDRVDAFGRGGEDIAHLFDTPGDDHFYAFADYSVMVSDHLYAVVKGFEEIQAKADKGGNDTAHIREVGTGVHLFANGSLAAVTGQGRKERIWEFETIEAEKKADASPTHDVRLGSIDFVFTDKGSSWIL